MNRLNLKAAAAILALTLASSPATQAQADYTNFSSLTRKTATTNVAHLPGLIRPTSLLPRATYTPARVAPLKTPGLFVGAMAKPITQRNTKPAFLWNTAGKSAVDIKTFGSHSTGLNSTRHSVNGIAITGARLIR